MFTNGFGEMTADDVKFSYERIADPAQASEYADDFAQLDHVEVTDRYSGVIVLKEPFAPLWTSSLPAAPRARIVSKKAVEQAGGSYTTEPPATAGPYRIQSWQPKQRLTLVRDPDWNGAPGGFAEIQIFPIEDEKAAEIAFEAGELDYTAVSVSSIPTFEASPPAGAKLIRKPSLAYVWLGMNTEAPPFDDPKVRQAVQRAVDVDAVLEAAYFGVADRATGIVAPGLIGHREKLLGDPARDLEEAKALLAEAGHPDGFSCTLDILNKTERLTAAQVIQANLAEIGIQVQINQHDSGTFWVLGSEADGDAVEERPADPEPLLDAARPVLRDRLVHARAGRRLELGALPEPGVRRAAPAGDGHHRRGRARPHVPPHAGPDGAVRRLRLPDPRDQRRDLPRHHRPGAPARRQRDPPGVPPGVSPHWSHAPVLPVFVARSVGRAALIERRL